MQCLMSAARANLPDLIRGTIACLSSLHILMSFRILLNEEIDLLVQLGGRKFVHEVNLEPVEEHNEQSLGSAWPGSPS
jgi:hypothetical protein